MTKNKEGILPIEWEDYDILDNDRYVFFDATFTEDFGSLKAGETFNFITVDYGEGIIEIYDNEDNDVVIDRINFKCVAI